MSLSQKCVKVIPVDDEVKGDNMQELHNQLLRDIRRLGIFCKFELKLKRYSSTYFGTYHPPTDTITIYVYRDKRGVKMYPYKQILFTLIHEIVHCEQWQDSNFKRIKGVMHNVEFHSFYNYYVSEYERRQAQNETYS